MSSEINPSSLTAPISPINSEQHADSEQETDNSQPSSEANLNYYDAMAGEYATRVDEIARSAWMKALVENQRQWIGIGEMGTRIKVLDYCAGTGFFSQALAPYVHDILAVDSARNMTIEFNKMAEETKDAHPDCNMRAVLGDLIEGEEPDDEAWDPSAELDLVIMSLAVNFFACMCCGVAGLQHNIQVVTSRLKHNGTILILDIEKDYAWLENAGSDVNNEHVLRCGRKLGGFGSLEVATALERLGMEDILVVEGEDLRFRFENVVDGELEVTDEVYFLLKAKKGSAYHDDVDDAVELQASG